MNNVKTGKAAVRHIDGMFKYPSKEAFLNKTKYIKHSVHFSDVNDSDNFEQREFGKIGDWLKGNKER